MFNNPKTISADYLIVGAGATGMAVADVLLNESDATMIIVDKYSQPGGHWNLAYPFVKLHQPAAYYGVSSVELSEAGLDEVGSNKGLRKLSSGAAINAYYNSIMQHKLLPSGRVQYFPLCEYLGNSAFKSTLTNQYFQVEINKKLVDCTHMQTKVPLTHSPNFKVDDDVTFIPINELPNLKFAPRAFTVIGGGKTGIDACIWLLENNVNPDNITWIISRDAWLTDRKNLQPSADMLKFFLNDRASQFEALAEAESIDELFELLELKGVLVRIDKRVKPSMYRGATVSLLELEQLKSIKNVIRLGHVMHIKERETILAKGTIINQSDQVFVDCSANALHHAKMRPVFDSNTITPQTVRGAQMVFSSALIAHIELAYDDDKTKNDLCTPIPLPDGANDWITMLHQTMINQQKWRKDEKLSKWLHDNRLDGFSHLLAAISPKDEELQDLLNRIRQSIIPGMEKLKLFTEMVSLS